MWLKNKIKEWNKPILTTLTHYKIHFKTIDGEEHTYSYMASCNERIISCSALEYYLIGKEMLKDDDKVMYPMTNIVSIRAEKDEEIFDVVEINDLKVWYQSDEIEIYKGE